MASPSPKGGAFTTASAARIRTRSRRPARLDGAGEATPQLTPEALAAGHTVIGALVLAGVGGARAVFEAIQSTVCAGDFGDLRAELAFRAFEELIDEGAPTEAVAVASRIRSYDRADVAFKTVGGEPMTWFAEITSNVGSCEPTVIAWYARQVAAAARAYDAQVAGEELAELAKSDPEAFWQRLRALAETEQRAAEEKDGRALPLVRVADIPDPGPAQWLIDQLWIDSAFGIVGAEPKSWKSWLTLYLGICVAGGWKAFNRYDVRQGPVLVFSAEGGKGLVRRRTAALCRAMGVEVPSDLWLIDLPVLHLDQPEIAERVIKLVERTKPALVILDPLRELHTGDENDAVTIAALLAPLRQLQRFGCACMLVHHLSKKSEGRGRSPTRGGQRLRGSSALHGATDSALYMETTGEGQTKRVTVTPEHRDEADGEPIKLRLRFHKLPELAVWLEIVTDDAESEEREEKAVLEREQKRKQILRAIRAACMPGRDPLRSATAILRIVKGTRTTVLSLVKEMVEDGQLVFDRTTGFRLVEESAA